MYATECGEQLGRDPSKKGSSKSLVFRSSSGEEGTLWDSSLLVALTVWDTPVLCTPHFPALYSYCISNRACRCGTMPLALKSEKQSLLSHSALQLSTKRSTALPRPRPRSAHCMSSIAESRRILQNLCRKLGRPDIYATTVRQDPPNIPRKHLEGALVYHSMCIFLSFPYRPAFWIYTKPRFGLLRHLVKLVF